jgi:hypothetical protein
MKTNETYLPCSALALHSQVADFEDRLHFSLCWRNPMLALASGKTTLLYTAMIALYSTI